MMPMRCSECSPPAPAAWIEIVTITGIGPYLRKQMALSLLSIVEYGSLCRNATIRVCPM